MDAPPGIPPACSKQRAEPEPQLREREPGQRAEQHRAQRDRPRHDDGVEDCLGQVDLVVGLPDVLQQPAARERHGAGKVEEGSGQLGIEQLVSVVDVQEKDIKLLEFIKNLFF